MFAARLLEPQGQWEDASVERVCAGAHPEVCAVVDVVGEEGAGGEEADGAEAEVPFCGRVGDGGLDEWDEGGYEGAVVWGGGDGRGCGVCGGKVSMGCGEKWREILTVPDFKVDYHFRRVTMELVILFGGRRCGFLEKGQQDNWDYTDPYMPYVCLDRKARSRS